MNVHKGLKFSCWLWIVLGRWKLWPSQPILTIAFLWNTRKLSKPYCANIMEHFQGQPRKKDPLDTLHAVHLNLFLFVVFGVSLALLRFSFCDFSLWETIGEWTDQKWNGVGAKLKKKNSRSFCFRWHRPLCVSRYISVYNHHFLIICHPSHWRSGTAEFPGKSDFQSATRKLKFETKIFNPKSFVSLNTTTPHKQNCKVFSTFATTESKEDFRRKFSPESPSDVQNLRRKKKEKLYERALNWDELESCKTKEVFIEIFSKQSQVGGFWSVQANHPENWKKTRNLFEIILKRVREKLKNGGKNCWGGKIDGSDSWYVCPLHSFDFCLRMQC